MGVYSPIILFISPSLCDLGAKAKGLSVIVLYWRYYLIREFVYFFVNFIKIFFYFTFCINIKLCK